MVLGGASGFVMGTKVVELVFLDVFSGFVGAYMLTRSILIS